jgi:hypothetical protein
VTTSEVSASGVPLVDDATDPDAQREADGPLTDPAALPETDGAPLRRDDAHREAIEAADEKEGRRSFFARIGGRAVVLPLACVAAFLVGFGSMMAVLRLDDRPGKPHTTAVPTTAPPSLSAITTPPTSAARATVASEPTPAAPEPVPAPEAAAAPAPRAAAAEPPPPSSSPTTVTTTTPSTTGVGGGTPGKQGATG